MRLIDRRLPLPKGTRLLIGRSVCLPRDVLNVRDIKWLIHRLIRLRSGLACVHGRLLRRRLRGALPFYGLLGGTYPADE